MHRLFHNDSITCVAHDKIPLKHIPINRRKSVAWNSQLWLHMTSTCTFLLYFTCYIVNFYLLFIKLLRWDDPMKCFSSSCKTGILKLILSRHATSVLHCSLKSVSVTVFGQSLTAKCFHVYPSYLNQIQCHRSLEVKRVFSALLNV